MPKKLNTFPLLLFIGTLVLLSSCITQQRCNEKFPPIVSDTLIVKDSTYYVHDTIYTPYQEITFSDDVPCDTLIVYKKEIKKNGLTGSVNITKGKLTFECKADSLQHIINTLRHQIIRERFKVQAPKNIEVRYTPWYMTAMAWLNLLWLFLIVGVYISIKWK